MLGFVVSLAGCSGFSNANESDNPLFNLGVEEIFENEGVRSLAKAAARNDIKKVQELINSGVAVNSVGVGNFTPLYWALKKGSKEGFKMLLENGANPNLLWKDGGSVIHYSAAMDDLDFLSLCLRYNGDAELSDGVEGKTPIFYAVEEKRVKNIELLLARGANINALDSSQSTPLVFAAMLNQYDMVHYLLQAGGDPAIKNRWGKGLNYLLEKSSRTMDRSSSLWAWREKVIDLLSE